MSFEPAQQVNGELSIWQRRGDSTYAAVVLVVFAAETVVLVALTWMSLLSIGGRVAPDRLWPVVIGAVASTGLALLVMAVFIMVQHAQSQRSSGRQRADAERWAERWTTVLFGDDPPPPAPLPAAGLVAALDLRELLKGEEGERLAGLLRDYGIEAQLIGQLGSARLAPRLGDVPHHVPNTMK